MIMRASGTTWSGGPGNPWPGGGGSQPGWLATNDNAARGSLGGAVGSGLALGGAAGSRLAPPPRAQQSCCRVLLLARHPTVALRGKLGHQAGRAAFLGDEPLPLCDRDDPQPPD